MIFRAARLDYANRFGIACFERKGDRSYCVERYLPTLKEIQDGVGETWMELDLEAAQSLVDALYDVGVRPTNAKPQDSTISAIQYHLEDMRQLVFKS